MSTFDCALCAGDATPRPLFVKERFSYVACRTCGFVFVSPRFVDPRVANTPMSGVRGEYAAEDSKKMASRNRKYARRLARLARHRHTGRLLEIGCREGHFLGVAAEHGWEAFGVEPSAATARAARGRPGVTIHEGLLEAARFPAGHFDVVYLCEVLEHVDQPVPMFREIGRVLRPGGVVWVKTGNVRSLSRMLRGPAWSYFAYRNWGHVSYFSPATMRRLFTAADLRLTALRTWGVEVPRGPLRSILGPVARVLRLGGHLEAIGIKDGRAINGKERAE